MVTFISLFLWLMTDVHQVEVSVDPLVASVEIVLDGRSIGVVTAPRWSVRCDFGEKPRPHELVAVAFGEDGVELGRARQLVNLPRPDAEVEIVLEGGNPETPEQLRVITESSERLDPLAVFVNFDGRAFLSSGDGRFPLPVHDRGQVHIIGPFEISRWWMPWLATHIMSPEAALPGQRLGEAVAVAGVRAAAGGAPRTIVLVLSGKPVDDSNYQTPAVREYLRALRVPLVVWSTAGDKAAGAWGEAADVSNQGSLNQASKRLLKELRRQWIVWVEGRHLPSDIELDPEVQGIRLAG